MAKSLYVGNLPWSVTPEELLEKFGEFGKVSDARILKEKETGRAKGFGFVEMSDDAEAVRAIDAMNGFNWGGRNIVVNEARTGKS
ncbi:MAG: RNA-binding protein [Candidatus Saganbacteria bacterium]|nr:RNA-binding protein [Candidatus Saganbacteria bacterium]